MNRFMAVGMSFPFQFQSIGKTTVQSKSIDKSTVSLDLCSEAGSELWSVIFVGVLVAYTAHVQCTRFLKLQTVTKPTAARDCGFCFDIIPYMSAI
jgi:hypothetical protein